MKFKYTGMYIQRDWLRLVYRISNATFNIPVAKEVCRAFEDNEIVLSRITTSYEKDLSNTPSFFDSYTQHCSIHDIDELTDDSWDGTFQAEYTCSDSGKKECPVLSLSTRKYGTEISVLYDFSQFKLHFVPDAADDRELSLDEFVKMIKGENSSENCKAFVTAVAMVKSEWYDDAYQLLHKIGRDKEAATLLPRDYRNQLSLEKGIMLREQGKYEEAKASLAKATDLKQTQAEMQETTYRQALHELNQKNYQKAFDLLIEVIEYKDARSLLQNMPLSDVSNENMHKQGQTVLFGRNGDLPIPWIVLEAKNGQSLLLSKYPLWCGPYHDIYEGVSWDQSSLCRKLNTVFRKEAFSFEEMSRILSNEDPINRIFLLSKDNKEYIDGIPVSLIKKEALLFKSLDDGRYRLGPINSWWLKDTKNPGPRACRVLELKEEKRILDEGVKCSYWVRPAIWVRTEKKRTFWGF